MPRLSVPGINGLKGLEEHEWFLVSDIAGVLRGLLYEVSLVTILAVLLIPITAWLLWKTAFGLRVRSVGEDPQAAESLGLNVYRYKYYGVVISGAMAGLGGVYLSTVTSAIYREGQTGGRGYIGLAAMIFGNWRPGGLAVGASLFGYTDALQLRRGSESVHALLILVGALLLALAVWEFIRRNGSWRSLPPSSASCPTYCSSLWTRSRRRWCRPRPTSPCWWCWRSRRNGSDHPPRTASRTGVEAERDGR